MIDIEVVVGTYEWDVIEAAATAAGFADRPEVVDAGIAAPDPSAYDPGGIGGTGYYFTYGLLVDQAAHPIGDPIAYERAAAAVLAEHLGVPVISAYDFDNGRYTLPSGTGETA